ncbi:HAMP domain-containing histidine kinase [Parasulfuritortus cantonensis]|uniref:histidine kinase n=1 Tax=Parasulfuritortus cantonensis TaxID=2528202 RepID=A0A4V2NVZ3_9PROT|nr:HAMP domain-containing sensor histidine kinase [Parasulfuritortus cantonensis]TCJ15352.1 HAMP domain-containing histidine kinase [Parasulfuritortus cantonensis]
MTGADFYPDSFWRSLKQLNAFRLFIAVFFTASALFSSRLHVIEPGPLPLLVVLGVGYLAAALIFHFLLRIRLLDFGRQLQLQLAIDILLITAFMHFGGGNETGLGLVLTVPMAAAGLHPNTRMMLALPALASLAMLVEQGLTGGALNDATGGYLRAALLSVGFVTVAGISHILAKGALGAARTASEKTREVAELARINAKVIQDLPNGILVLSGDGLVMQHNQQAERLLGCPMAGRAELAACHADLAGAWQAWLSGQGNGSAVLAANDAGVRLRYRLLELGPDRRAGAVVIVEDMSELEQEATQMKLAALGRLTANLAHEIRNPLSAINHAAQLLGEDVGADPGAARLTRIIEDNVSRLNYLVEDVLSLSRRDRQNREAIRLAEFLPDFVHQYQQSEGVAPGVIRLDPGADLAVWFDRLHLHQILWNLCRNACRHCSGQPGSVVFSYAASGDSVAIEIANDGASIPEAMRLRLFEPFFSTDKSGTGLGLYIALELAEANDGQLRCLGQGQGARFRLTAKMAR